MSLRHSVEVKIPSELLVIVTKSDRDFLWHFTSPSLKSPFKLFNGFELMHIQTLTPESANYKMHKEHDPWIFNAL
jgi:hypothetical protein